MSDYNQKSFLGGMNLLLDDTRLQDNQYRVGINVRNRFDGLIGIPQSVEDILAPAGLKQGLTTFGEYVILFVAGSAYYRLYNEQGWTQIDSFSMSPTATRFWFQQVPVSLTNYARSAISSPTTGSASVNAGIIAQQLEGISAGNLPGLLVQDNIQQPMFIYINTNGRPVARRTQTYREWTATYSADGTQLLVDKREYVPVGNCMTYMNGILFIAGQDNYSIYRSVSGRPLDFMVNVTAQDLTKITPAADHLNPTYDEIQANTNSLAWGGQPGGDASTTAYSVGVGGISCLRTMSTGALFVSAANANFSVSLNTSPNAPTVFGEYTFLRQSLFEATNLSDRTILDSLGDTRFIGLTGVRSFNSVEQFQNEGKNDVFSSTIQAALQGIVQDAGSSAAMFYDNYEFYSLSTIFGPAIAVYDTITSCWVSFDVGQAGGKQIKQFAKIELSIQALFGISTDDKVYQLYAGTEDATSIVRTLSVNYSVISSYTGSPVRLSKPECEVKLSNFRFVLNQIDEDCSASVIPFVNGRQTTEGEQTKGISYVAPNTMYSGLIQLPDTNKMIYNGIFQFPNCEQGWCAHVIFSWTGGNLSQYSMNLQDLTPINPLNSQP